MNKLRIITLSLLTVICSFAYAQQNLTLDKVTVVSRHGVRAPLKEYLDNLDEITGDGYQWTRWSVPGSHLTLRGGALETLFGEYFRLWLDAEKFKIDSVQQVYFGASSKQRTIATARAFAAGMLPLMTVPVDYKIKADGSVGYLDPDYLPLLNESYATDGTFDTVAFKDEAYRELGELQAPSYEYLEKILRMKNSEYARKNGDGHFDNTVGVNLFFYKNGEKQEPRMHGGLNKANMASDAFILQYYEMENARAAAFGRRLSFNDWKKLASIKDYYGEILFAKAPIISVNISHCMLQRIQAEMSPEGHKFAFLCTHDSMIAAVLAALRVEDYELPNTIEVKTPIGFKLVLEQWIETDGNNPQKYVRACLVYQSTEQIRGMKQMDLSNPPMSYELSFVGVEKSPNGMYLYEDFMNHLQKSIEAYNATARGHNPWE